MKVAYVIPSLQKPSGWRTFSLAVIGLTRSKEHHGGEECQSVNNSQVEPVLVAPFDALDELRDLYPNLPIYGLPVTQQASFASLRGTLHLMQSYQMIRQLPLPPVDLVHSLEAYPTGLVGSWLARNMHVPHILTANGTYGVVWFGVRSTKLFGRFALDRRFYRRVLKQANLICPISTGTAEQMRRVFGPELASVRIHTILPGNDFTRTVPASLALERSLPEIPTFLTVGEVKSRKGHAVSIAAFARVKQHYPQARYWIVGRYQPASPYFIQLQQLIAEHGITDVTFLGDVTDRELRRCYQEASVFVLTPQQEGFHFEGFGLVYLEAGAYGLPVVGTRSGGVSDAVREGETGFLCEESDISGIASAMQRLIGDPDLARQMGMANRRWAETLTWARFAQEQVQAYQDVLKDHL